MHHKKGRPSAATSHESRSGNPSFLHLRSPPPRPASNSEVEQITRNTGLGKPLGLYPNTSTRCYTTARRSKDPTRSLPQRQRHHKLYRGHKEAYIPISTPKQRNRHADTQTASLTDGNIDTHIIHIRGAHSPPPRSDLTTHAKQQMQQQPYGPAGMLGQNSELSPWLARHHPLGEGYGQARSVLGPEQGTEQGMPTPACDTGTTEKTSTKPVQRNAG